MLIERSSKNDVLPKRQHTPLQQAIRGVASGQELSVLTNRKPKFVAVSVETRSLR